MNQTSGPWIVGMICGSLPWIWLPDTMIKCNGTLHTHSIYYNLILVRSSGFGSNISNLPNTIKLVQLLFLGVNNLATYINLLENNIPKVNKFIIVVIIFIYFLLHYKKINFVIGASLLTKSDQKYMKILPNLVVTVQSCFF